MITMLIGGGGGGRRGGGGGGGRGGGVLGGIENVMVVVMKVEKEGEDKVGEGSSCQKAM